MTIIAMSKSASEADTLELAMQLSRGNSGLVRVYLDYFWDTIFILVNDHSGLWDKTPMVTRLGAFRDGVNYELLRLI